VAALPFCSTSLVFYEGLEEERGRRGAQRSVLSRRDQRGAVMLCPRHSASSRMRAMSTVETSWPLLVFGSIPGRG